MRLPATLRASANDDGLVLLNVETGQIYTSNAVGGRIWRLLEEGQSEAEIAAQLAQRLRPARGRRLPTMCASSSAA